MENLKKDVLEINITYVNGKYCASIKGFSRFSLCKSRITDIFDEIQEKIKEHLDFCQKNQLLYPSKLTDDYEISYKYRMYAMLALIKDMNLLSKESGIAVDYLRGITQYVRKPSPKTCKQIFNAANHLGQKIEKLERVDFALCPNDNLISEYSGLSLFDIKEYKNENSEDNEQTAEKILKAMHQIGLLYQSLVYDGK